MKQPMFAAKAPAVLQFPLYASPKIDGVRAVIRDAVVMSRTLKAIPNGFVQDNLGLEFLSGLDGELTVGPPNAANVMQATTSGVMSREGEPAFTFWVFDFWTNQKMPFGERNQIMTRAFKDGALSKHPHVKQLPQELVRNEAELNAYEALQLKEGFEGVMLRVPNGIYKYGRSTAREGYLMKLKRWVDAEAVVVGFKEQLHNGNEATTDELGRTKRSSHTANMRPMGVLGAFMVRTPEGVEFDVGTGLTAAQRSYFWAAKDLYLGQSLTYKSFPLGVKDAPRFPVFKGFRNQIDIGEPK